MIPKHLQPLIVEIALWKMFWGHSQSGTRSESELKVDGGAPILVQLRIESELKVAEQFHSGVEGIYAVVSYPVRSKTKFGT